MSLYFSLIALCLCDRKQKGPVKEKSSASASASPGLKSLKFGLWLQRDAHGIGITNEQQKSSSARSLSLSHPHFLSMHFTATMTWSISGRMALMLCRNSAHPVGLCFKHSSSFFPFFLFFHKNQDILNIHYLSHPSRCYALNDITLATKPCKRKKS